MKITIVCQEVPYPAMHGSRIDMWRRIKAFAAQGIELQVIFWWFGIQPTAEDIAEIYKYVSKVHSIEIEQTPISRLRRITDLLTYPLETSSRLIKGEKLANLRHDVREFDPHIIFLDGIHGSAIATSLSQDLNIPIVTRSHNIEHMYAKKMLQAAIGIKDKFRRYLSLFNLEQAEKKILTNSTFFYDISADDLKFWQDIGLENGRLLPPIIEIENKSNLEIEKSYDLVFLGNLNAENNVGGVIWFVNEVLPLIRNQLPEATLLVAGFKPVDRIRQICEKTTGVSLSINPDSASDTYRSGRVLINPILTGSGVKIKSIEMLQFGIPIVSTTEGVSGLPTAVKQYFKIADSSGAFANAAIECLSNNYTLPIIDRQLLAASFGPEIINNVITDLKSISRT